MPSKTLTQAFTLTHYIDGEVHIDTFERLDELESLVDPDGILAYIGIDVTLKVQEALNNPGQQVVLQEEEHIRITVGE